MTFSRSWTQRIGRTTSTAALIRAALTTLIGLGVLGCSDTHDDETAAMRDAGGDVPAEATVPDEPRDLVTAWRESPLFKSGSRLRARVHDGGQDAVAFVSLYDSELEVDCSLRVAEDGVQRCLPGGGTFYYLDADCTQLVLRDDFDWDRDQCPSAPPTFVLGPGDSGPECDDGFPVYRVGAALSTGSAYELTDIGCLAIDTQRCLYEVDREPDATFLGGEVHTRPGDHGLAVDFARYEDGTELVLTARDTERDVACHRDRTMSESRCVPADHAYTFGEYFSGSECAGSPLASYDGHGPCATPTVITQGELGACGYVMSVFEVGPEVAMASVRSSSSDECFQRESGAWQRFYALGDPLDTSARPALRELSSGTGRLSVRYTATEDGTPVAYGAPAFHDAELDFDCEIRKFSDDTLRCVPEQMLYRENIGPFADAECTAMIVSSPKLEPGCDDEYSPFVENAVVGTGSIGSVHALGPSATLAGDTVFSLIDDVCVASTSDSASRYHMVGDEIDLAAVTERVE